MLLDSFWEAASPVRKTLGCPRLNTRFALYVYASKKLSLAKANPIAVVNDVNKLSDLESVNISYTFNMSPKN
jgi:hypothetical protein